MEVKYVKSSLFLYLNRIHTATFLPFIAYNTDNQLITDTAMVLKLHYSYKLLYSFFHWSINLQGSQDSTRIRICQLRLSLCYYRVSKNVQIGLLHHDFYCFLSLLYLTNNNQKLRLFDILEDCFRTIARILILLFCTFSRFL